MQQRWKSIFKYLYQKKADFFRKTEKVKKNITVRSPLDQNSNPDLAHARFLKQKVTLQS